MHSRSTLFATTAALAALFLGACPGAPTAPDGVPDRPGGKPSSIDPNTCGNYAASDAGRKLKAFLEATVTLRDRVVETESYIRDTCVMMGQELAIPVAELEGDTKTVCGRVARGIDENLKVGLEAGAQLDIQYEPARCEVSVEAAATAAAECEAQASADVAVSCQGTCEGTCEGACEGTCATQNADGSCAGQCEGTCSGSCSGQCVGSADVDASAECEAKAEVSANVEAECTKPEVTVSWDAGIVVDTTKVERVKAALEVGLPRVLEVKARVTGPLKVAFTTWLSTAEELRKAGRSLFSSLGDQAMCVAGQFALAFEAIAQIQVSFEVSVSVSAEVSGSAGGGA